MTRLPHALLLALGLAGCAPSVRLAVAPDLLSTHWSQPAPEIAPAPFAPADLGAAIGSAELQALLARAEMRNTDIGIARARIAQSRALLRIARGAMLPVVSASAGLSGSRTNRSGSAGGSGSGGSGARSSPFDFSDAFAGVDVGFDLDLGGGARAEGRAASDRLRASEQDLEAAMILVRADVARAFVQRAALAARIGAVERNVEQARELERIIRIRLDAGEATRVDFGLQRIQVRQLETEKVRLEQALDSTRTALAVLVGEEAPLFASAPAVITDLAVPAFAPVQPPELLQRRPDLRAAEARIAAAGGDVAAARAAFFPRIRLTAGGLAQMASLGGPITTTLSLGADLLAPIFDRGRLRGGLEGAAARQWESVESYRQALLVALSEVENALSAASRSEARERLILDVVEEARLTARLARLQYMEGEADLQQVLEAEQRLIEAEDARAVALQERLEAAIDLYAAMGGGAAAPAVALAAGAR